MDNTTVEPTSTNSTTEEPTEDLEEALIIKASIIGVLAFLLLLCLIVIIILCKIVYDNRKIRKKIKAQKERKRLRSESVVKYGAAQDGSIQTGDSDSLLSNDAYISHDQVFQSNEQHYYSQVREEDSRRPTIHFEPSYSTSSVPLPHSVEEDQVIQSNEQHYYNQVEKEGSHRPTIQIEPSCSISSSVPTPYSMEDNQAYLAVQTDISHTNSTSEREYDYVTFQNYS